MSSQLWSWILRRLEADFGDSPTLLPFRGWSRERQQLATRHGHEQFTVGSLGRYHTLYVILCRSCPWGNLKVVGCDLFIVSPHKSGRWKILHNSKLKLVERMPGSTCTCFGLMFEQQLLQGYERGTIWLMDIDRCPRLKHFALNIPLQLEP